MGESSMLLLLSGELCCSSLRDGGEDEDKTDAISAADMRAMLRSRKMGAKLRNESQAARSQQQHA